MLRLADGYTFDAFVEETGLGRGYVSELERGLVVPTIHSLAKIAAALRLTVADLVIGDSLRERLFEATRGLPDADLERLFAGIGRLRKPSAPTPPPRASSLRTAEPTRRYKRSHESQKPQKSAERPNRRRPS